MSSPNSFWMLSLFPAMTVKGWYCRLTHRRCFCPSSVMGFCLSLNHHKAVTLESRSSHLFVFCDPFGEVGVLCVRQPLISFHCLGQFPILNIFYRWLMLISVITIVATIMDNCDFILFYSNFISHLDMMLRRAPHILP